MSERVGDGRYATCLDFVPLPAGFQRSYARFGNYRTLCWARQGLLGAASVRSRQILLVGMDRPRFAVGRRIIPDQTLSFSAASVGSAVSTMSAQCRLMLRLRTSYCAAANGRNGPRAE